MSAFVPIGVTTSIPANNTEPTMAGGAVVTLTDSGNVTKSGRRHQAQTPPCLINAEASDKVA